MHNFPWLISIQHIYSCDSSIKTWCALWSEHSQQRTIWSMKSDVTSTCKTLNLNLVSSLWKTVTPACLLANYSFHVGLQPGTLAKLSLCPLVLCVLLNIWVLQPWFLCIDFFANWISMTAFESLPGDYMCNLAFTSLYDLLAIENRQKNMKNGKKIWMSICEVLLFWNMLDFLKFYISITAKITNI